MKTIKKFESFVINEKAESFKYIEATGDSQTERLLVEDHNKYIFIKQGGPGAHQVYLDPIQASQLVELLQKFIREK